MKITNILMGFALMISSLAGVSKATDYNYSTQGKLAPATGSGTGTSSQLFPTAPTQPSQTFVGVGTSETDAEKNLQANIAASSFYADCEEFGGTVVAGPIVGPFTSDDGYGNLDFHVSQTLTCDLQ